MTTIVKDTASNTNVEVADRVQEYPEQPRKNVHEQRAMSGSMTQHMVEDLCLSAQEPEYPSTTGFDLESLCLSQDFGAMAEVEQVIVNVPFCKPEKEWFIRVNPNFTRYLAVLSEGKENYVVIPSLVSELAGDVTRKLVVPAITRQGKLFFWPLKIEVNRPLDGWSKSAMAGMETAKTKWTKLRSNMDAGSYDVVTAKGYLAEPAWPETDFAELLSISIGKRIISSMNHPVIKRLNGEF